MEEAEESNRIDRGDQPEICHHPEECIVIRHDPDMGLWKSL